MEIRFASSHRFIHFGVNEQQDAVKWNWFKTRYSTCFSKKLTPDSRTALVLNSTAATASACPSTWDKIQLFAVIPKWLERPPLPKYITVVEWARPAFCEMCQFGIVPIIATHHLDHCTSGYGNAFLYTLSPHRFAIYSPQTKLYKRTSKTMMFSHFMLLYLAWSVL